MTDLEEILDRPADAEGADSAKDAKPETKRAEKRGKLLDLDDIEAAKHGVKCWLRDEQRMKKLRVRWKANKLRRMGIVGVQVRGKDQDETAWSLYAPPSSEPLQPVPNKARRLCRRLTSHLFVDPPEPEALPRTDEDEDRSAAEFATRVLSTEGDDSGLNVSKAYRRAFSLGCTYGSGFVRFYVDPYAGGFRARTVKANSQAPMGIPEAEAVSAQWPGSDYVTRFVTQQGVLTDDPAEAAQQWMPRLRKEVLTGVHVRFDPPHCDGIADANGVHLGFFKTVRELKAQFPKNPIWKNETKLGELTKFRPDHAEDLLAPNRREQLGKQDNTDTVKDESLIFVHEHYYKACHQYQEGAHAIFGGNFVAFERDTWVETKRDGTSAPMDIPIAQLPQFGDEDEDDLSGPYAIGAMDLLGGLNEARGETVVTMLEHLDRYRNRKVFYPITSALQPKQMQAPGGAYLPINPGGEPKYEDMGDEPKMAVDLYEHLTLEMDDEIALQQLAQGLADPSVKSGFHATQVTEQAIIGLSDLIANRDDAFKRGWRIMLQQIRKSYTVEQHTRFLGDDNEYKSQAFVGTDLGDTRDVLISKGSGTMLSPSAKAAQAEHLFASTLIDHAEFRRMIHGNLGGQLGMQDNPHHLRVMRQITEWQKGVPQDLIAEAEQMAAQMPTPEPQVDPMTGEVMPPMDPVAEAIGAYGATVFERRAVDFLPEVAALRLDALGRAQAGTKFSKQDPAWQAILTAEFEEMRAAAGVMTVMEQGAMAAEQQAQEMATAGNGKPPNGKKPSAPPAEMPPRVPGSASTPAEARQTAPAM